MIRRKIEKQSIIYKITFFVVLIVIAQAALLTFFMVSGGVLERAKENAFQSFYEKVNNRNNYIQREMKNRWTNIDPYVTEISAELNDGISSDAYFPIVLDKMIDMLRTTQTTGVFIILNDRITENGDYPALYLRDYDPLLNDYANSDIYMLIGPSDLSRNYKMPLDEYWRYGMTPSQVLSDFYQKPFQNAALSNNPKLLGYWSTPFQLFGTDLPVITYTMPLFDADRKLRGIVGIEVSVSYLSQNMPASDIQTKDSLGYMLAYRQQIKEPLMPIVSQGALQKRMLTIDKPLELLALDTDKGIYTVTKHNSHEKLYACVTRLNLSYSNTPFDNEEWYLTGLISESQLLGYVKRIQNVLLVSVCISALIGILGGVFVSYRLSAPIIRLAKQVRASDREKPIQLESTGLIEVDELSKAMEMANNALLDSASRMSRIIDLVSEPIGAFEMHDGTDRLLVTDQLWRILGADEAAIMQSDNQQELFKAYLDRILACPEPDEDHVYRIEQDINKWVKIQIRRHKNTTIGVIIDISDAILAKKELLQARDLDPLTKLWNRQAFQWRFENWQQHEHSGVAALLMFDLDNLKSVNDTYGHKWGDTYIHLCAKALQHLAEPTQMMVARRSGDEFVMLLYDFPDKSSIRTALDDFFQRISQAQIEFPDGLIRPLTISAGFVWLESNNVLPYDELLHIADEALYTSKKERKGSYTEASRFN